MIKFDEIVLKSIVIQVNLCNIVSSMPSQKKNFTQRAKSKKKFLHFFYHNLCENLHWFMLKKNLGFIDNKLSVRCRIDAVLLFSKVPTTLNTGPLSDFLMGVLLCYHTSYICPMHFMAWNLSFTKHSLNMCVYHYVLKARQQLKIHSYPISEYFSDRWVKGERESQSGSAQAPVLSINNFSFGYKVSKY